MKTLVFCNKEMQKNMLPLILGKKTNEKDCLYIAMNKKTFSVLSDKGLPSIAIYDVEAKVASNPDKILEKSLHLISSLKKTKFFKGKSLPYLFTENGFSYWNVIEGPLICYDLYPMVFALEVCRELLNKEINNIILPDLNRLIYRALYQYADSRNISVRVLKHSKFPNRATANIKANYLPWFKEVLHLFRTINHKKSSDFSVIGEKTSGLYKILFLCFFSRQIESILPILRKLKNEQNVDSVVLLSSGAAGREILEKEGITFFEIEDLLRQVSDIKLRIRNFKRWSKWKHFWNNLNSDFQPEFNNTRIFPIIKDNVLSYINPYLFNLSDCVKKILQSIQPNLMVQVDDVNVLNRTFLFSGKTLKIPCLHIQYGMTNTQAKDWLSNRSDKIAVFGPYFKEILINTGIDEKKIVPTGQPRYDDLLRLKKAAYKRKTEKNKKNKLSKKLLFSSVPYFENSNEFSYGYAALSYEEYVIHLQALYSQISRIDNIELLIKLHPNTTDAEEHHIDVLSGIHLEPMNIHFVSRHDNIFDLLVDCDALITHHSTTAFEAMIFSKPVFIINLTGRPDPTNYTEGGAAAGIYREEDICPIISNVLFSQEEIKRMLKAQKHFLTKRYAGLDGNATDNTIKLIKEMTGNAV